jgi:predicted AAA+ superfamily ATPase
VPVRERQLRPTLHRFAKAFPVLAITGSRQSGKTTLARRVFSDLKCVSLEAPSKFAFAQGDPKGFLARFGRVLKIAADTFPDLRLLATGSSTLAATSKFKDSLSGRKRHLHLVPVRFDELAASWR